MRNTLVTLAAYQKAFLPAACPTRTWSECTARDLMLTMRLWQISHLKCLLFWWVMSVASSCSGGGVAWWVHSHGQCVHAYRAVRIPIPSIVH